MIKLNVWKDRIIKCVMLKFGRLKIDNGEDTLMSFDDNILSYSTREID